jgi:hypothetical protein
VVAAATAASCASLGLGNTTTPADSRVPLEAVIAQLDSALLDYQAKQDSSAAVIPAVRLSVLPKLTSAEFAFKSTVDLAQGGSVKLWIITLGSSVAKEAVHEVTFTYAAPKKPHGTITPHTRPAPVPTFRQELVSLMTSTADALAHAKSAAGLPFEETTISLEYGVTLKTEIAGQAPILFLTVNGDFSGSRNDVQTLKLTFAKPDSA